MSPAEVSPAEVSPAEVSPAGAGSADELTVTTFHGLGLRILREHPEAAGLPPSFGVADEPALVRVAAELTGSERDGRKLAGDPQGRRCAPS